MDNQLWSWVLGIIGLIGFILAGRKVWWAWYVNIGNQVIWTAYSIVTAQWGFLVVAALYFWVFTGNAIRWTKEHKAEQKAKSTLLKEELFYGRSANTLEDRKRMWDTRRG